MVDDTIEQLKYLIAHKLDLDLQEGSIDTDAPLLEGGLKLDSLAIVELITLIEETFGFQFGEEDLNMDAFGSVRSLAAVIAPKRVPAMA